MYPFLQTLLTMTATASVAALVVMVLRLPLKKAPRWITCALWLVVLLRMVCPVTFQAPVSLIPDPVAQGTYTTALLPTETETVPVQTQTTSTEAVVAAPAQTAPTVQPATVVFLLWAVGAGGMALWAVVSYLRLRHRVADAVLLFDSIYETDRVDTPFVCGFFRPRIYLPAGLDPTDRAYVLLHEQAHLRRRDHLTKPLGWLALCLHWFNPVLWAAYRLYCRDVETACDQAVVKHFDRTDTAGYAAALLHLGRRTTLPQAVPLAFGEESAKGRIRGVLSYKKPAFWVALAAVIVCLLTGVLLLADPSDGSSGTVQLEGIALNDGYVVNRGAALDCPEDLRQDLAALLVKHGHRDYTALDRLPSFPDDTVCLSAQGAATVFYFDPATLTLTRCNRDTYSTPIKQAAAAASLAEDPDYLAWKEALAEYQRHARADQLYALKNPYIGDHIADGKILGAANAWLGGNGTTELQTTTEPYGITLHLTGTHPFAQDQARAEAHLKEVAVLFLALVDNAGTFSVTWESPTVTDGFTIEADPAHKGLTQEAFRALYDQVCTGPIPSFSQTYTVTEVLYLSPEVSRFSADTLFGTFTIADQSFQAELGSVLSSAWPETLAYEIPGYRNSTDRAPIVAPDGTVFDLSRYETADVVTVCDSIGQDTGYRVYRLDGETWVGLWTDQQLTYLLQLTPST